jgi:NAD(P)H-dependent flavin oxidoreductase YrpB (nitropropane dioxygenase family)
VDAVCWALHRCPASSFARTADIEQMALYAGQSCSLIDAVQPAAEIVAEIVRDVSAAMERRKGWREP